jgi:hypothetical protein
MLKGRLKRIRSNETEYYSSRELLQEVVEASECRNGEMKFRWMSMIRRQWGGGESRRRPTVWRIYKMIVGECRYI